MTRLVYGATVEMNLLELGESVLVRACMSPQLPGEALAIQVEPPGGKRFSVVQKTDQAGCVTTEVPASPGTWRFFGLFTGNALHASARSSALEVIAP